jgi:hypothetical protein
MEFRDLDEAHCNASPTVIELLDTNQNTYQPGPPPRVTSDRVLEFLRPLSENRMLPCFENVSYQFT